MAAEVIVWKLLDLGFDLMAMGWKREAIVAEAKAKQEAGASAEDIAKWLRDMRVQSAALARKEIAESPDD
jgi:glycine cleavage system protein P-like pyridoxal-binding family